jgi:hypothetical protein
MTFALMTAMTHSKTQDDMHLLQTPNIAGVKRADEDRACGIWRGRCHRLDEVSAAAVARGQNHNT